MFVFTLSSSISCNPRTCPSPNGHKEELQPRLNRRMSGCRRCRQGLGCGVPSERRHAGSLPSCEAGVRGEAFENKSLCYWLLTWGRVLGHARSTERTCKRLFNKNFVATQPVSTHNIEPLNLLSVELCCERPLKEDERRLGHQGSSGGKPLGSDELRMEGSGCSIKAASHVGVHLREDGVRDAGWWTCP